MVALAVTPQTDSLDAFCAHLATAAGNATGSGPLIASSVQAYRHDLLRLNAWLLAAGWPGVEQLTPESLSAYCLSVPRSRAVERGAAVIRRYLAWQAQTCRIDAATRDRCIAALAALKRRRSDYSALHGALDTAAIARALAQLDAEAMEARDAADLSVWLMHERLRVVLLLLSRCAIPLTLVINARVGALGYAGKAAWLVDADGQCWDLDRACCDVLAGYIAALAVYQRAEQGRALRSTDWLFPSLASNSTGKHVTRQRVHWQLVALGERAGTPRLVATSLISYALTQAIEGGATARQLSERFHRALETTERVVRWRKNLPQNA